MYVCMYVCMYASMYVCMYICIYTCSVIVPNLVLYMYILFIILQDLLINHTVITYHWIMNIRPQMLQHHLH